ncbi:MAG: TolC family protein [Paucimonas sp.]|nr:TolC family protein [Paucimonas sp.]
MTVLRFGRLCGALLSSLALLAACPALAEEAVPGLPPEALVKQVLADSPQVSAARALEQAEQANARRLAAGNYEWSVRAHAQRRTDAAGQRFLENEVALERPVRAPGKAGKDEALGETGVRLAQARVADAWHEAARGLLRAWFDWMREARAAQRLQDHARVLEQQVDIVRRRVKAGDAPRLEQMLAETEFHRAELAQAQSAARARRLEADLRKRYPALHPAAPTALPVLEAVAGDVDKWQAGILAHNHEIELAELEAAHSRLAAERALLERRADPTFGLRYAQERDRQERILGVSMSVPFSGAARTAQADAATARAEAAAQKARETRIRVESDASQVALQAQSAYSLAERSASIAEQAQANAALVGRAYSLGEATLNDTLLARRQSLDATGASEQARIDALEAHARLLLDMHKIWSLRGHDD